MASAWKDSKDTGLFTLHRNEFELRQVAHNLEELCDDLGRLQVGGALIHKVNNIRARLLAQTRRLEICVQPKKEWQSDGSKELAAGQGPEI